MQQDRVCDNHVLCHGRQDECISELTQGKVHQEYRGNESSHPPGVVEV